MSTPYLIAGLGNPGPGYELTRHNLGFLVVDYLAESYKIGFSKPAGVNGALAEGKVAGRECLLFKPLTYMNNSGVALNQIIRERQIVLENILIVCDDLSLDFGQTRIRSRGSDGGHNGLASVIVKTGSQDFARLRVGIGNPEHKDETVDYVLEEFSSSEKTRLEEIVRRAAECCETWLNKGIENAMSQFNQRI